MKISKSAALSVKQKLKAPSLRTATLRSRTENKSAQAARNILDLCLGYLSSGKNVLENSAILNLNQDIAANLEGFVQQLLESSLKTFHPNFANQLYTGVQFESIFADILTSFLNTSLATYQISPALTQIETWCIHQILKKIGYSSQHKPYGLFTTGGSNSNLMGMLVARNHFHKSIKLQGNKENMVAFISEDAHYSFLKASNVIGVGEKNLITIKTDDQGKMSVEDLVEKIRQSKLAGKNPFFIGATLGTTVLGALDPIGEIARVAKSEGLWLHVDGAWGGGTIVSDKFTENKIYKSIKNADSFCVDFHKLNGLNLVTSLFFVKDKESLRQAVAGGGEEYLFQNPDETPDLGELSIQCGRRTDALKLFFYLKLNTQEQLNQKIDYLFNLKKDFIVALKKHPKDFEMIFRPEFLNICFQVKPSDPHADVNKFNEKIQKRLRMKKMFYVNFAKMKGKVFQRYVCINPRTTKLDLENYLTHLKQIKREIESEV